MSEILISGNRVIDLSQVIEPEMPIPAAFPVPPFEVLISQSAGSHCNVESIHFFSHSGTHFDSPYHFFSNLDSVDRLPVENLIGPAIVVDMSDRKGSVALEAQDFMDWEQSSGETILASDIVLLRTDHSKNWRPGSQKAAYWQDGWPYLARGAAEYLVNKQIKALGVESFDPDSVDLQNLGEAEFPAHCLLLAKGILILENLTNLDQIPTRRCMVIALPVKFKGCSASPLRVIAVVKD